MTLTPEQFAQLLDGPPPQPQTPSTSAPAAQTPTVAAPLAQPRELTPEELFGEPAPAGAVPQAPTPPTTPEQPGLGSRIASDIGTGVTELPRAALKGARDAAQETATFVDDVSGWQSRILDPILGPAPEKPAPQLPEVDAPKSTTGKLAASVSQFITGLVGLGKLTKPLEAASGLAQAGRAAKLGVETAKAATVGAVAFDPHGPRLADIVESVPTLSNPVTRYLKSNPGDTAAEGRIKNALESIGMDAALIGGIMVGTRVYKVMADFKAGKATQVEVDRAVAEAEAQQAAASTPQAPASGSPPGEPQGAIGVDAPTPSPTLEAGTPSTAPRQRDVLDLSSSPEVAPAVGPGGTVVSEAPQPARLEVTPEQTQSLLKAMREDADALSSAGSWDAALDAGHKFGQGERIPWQKIALEDGPQGDGLATFVARLSDELKAPLDAARGGDANGVLRDAHVRQMVEQSARLFGDAPQDVIGRLAMAGEASRNLAVDLEVSYLAANRSLQDAFGMASRIKAGDLTEWGGNAETAAEALRQQLETATTLYSYGQAIRAGAGRTMRRMREEFGPKLADIEALRGLDAARLVDAIVETKGDPRAIQQLTQRGALQRLGDAFEFSYINGLLWNPTSHVVNFVTNAYMLGFRPLERMIGGVILDGGTSSRAFRQGFQEYAYIGASLGNAWRMAVETWKRGDSMLAPRSIEKLMAPRINPAELQFKTPDNLPSVLHNALTALVKVTGFPTRALGTVDEFVQQTVYQAKVQAKAHMDGIQDGLTGKELDSFVRDRLRAAYDADLRATDAGALQEARTATFQQELLPGTLGHTIASAATKHRVVRLILPFVRTPTNVLRYGQKLTPGLNLMQHEYRQMLSGKMGAEAQAQAVGQMSLGSLFLGTAAFLASSGTITGAGPSNPKLKATLMATGWRPYSLVTVHADGSRTYATYGRFDPIGLPFGIVADIVDALSNTDEDEEPSQQVAEALTAITFGLAKQLSNKSYLKSINDAVEAFSDPDRAGEKFIGNIASNTIPLSSGLRFANPDEHLRDARTVTDRMLATIPGLSEKLPPRRDVWGDPITVNKGLWVTTDADLVDAEMRRMILEGGMSFGPPSPAFNGVDLRDVTMVDGKNAYDVYQQLAAKPSAKGYSLKETVAKTMKTAAYQRAPDGEVDVRGTKLWMIGGTISAYRTAASKRIRADANVRKALSEKHLAVQRAYAASKAPQTPQKSAERNLGEMGKAFGVDLEGLMKIK